jgi:Protein of unknown function (DUF3606)
MADITKPIVPERSKIVLEREDEVKHWCRHFGVTRDELTLAIEEVGNSAAAVRKQLASMRSARGQEKQTKGSG